MNFFEGRIYKPQGKNLADVVSSRVPVVLGSLSVQDGTLYYCKSCTYKPSSKTYELIWAEVVALAQSSTASTAKGDRHVKKLTEKRDTTENQGAGEAINYVMLDFQDNTILPKYPTEGSVLAATMGTTSVTIADALQYATMSTLKIDGYQVKPRFHASTIPWRSAAEKPYYNLHKSMYHEVIPFVYDNGNGRSIYSPVFGATQVIAPFASATTATPTVLVFGNEASLVGAHFVFTYRTFYYAGVVDKLLPNGTIEIRDVHTNGREEFTISSIEWSAPSSGDFIYSEDRKVDQCSSPINDVKAVKLTISVSCSSSLTNDKYAFYLKLDPSFTGK